MIDKWLRSWALMSGSSGIQVWLHPHPLCALGEILNTATPVLHLENRRVKPLIILSWEFNDVLELRVCSKQALGDCACYSRLPNARLARVHPPRAHEASSPGGSRPLSLAGPFQSPSVLASWTSCVRTASSACSSPWCVTASSSAAMARTRMRRSRDAVSGVGGGGSLAGTGETKGCWAAWGCAPV